MNTCKACEREYYVSNETDTAQEAFCPFCGRASISSKAPEDNNIKSRLTKLESHDLPNIADHAKSLENRLTALERLVGTHGNRFDKIASIIDEGINTFFANAETGPDSPICGHITATVDAYLDTKELIDQDALYNSIKQGLNENIRAEIIID